MRQNLWGLDYILEEIKKVRIDRIKFLLVNSDLTVQQIAFELNFRNFENITRYFKQATGLKPLEYRNKFKRIQAPERNTPYYR